MNNSTRCQTNVDLVLQSIVSQTATKELFANSLQPQSTAEVADAIRQAYEYTQSVCATGGCTALGCGIRIPAGATEISTANIAEVVDYPHEDMTITVGSGITIAQLQNTLAEQGQRLPVDVPQCEQATLGGAIATNQSGPRRYGCGTLRDYVIGVTAVDGRGVVFSGGGRVVKNVAGYDFCKLLIGSRGTLGILTQVTLKVLPKPETSALFSAPVANENELRAVLEGIASSPLTPVTIDYVRGVAWPGVFAEENADNGRVVIGFEGTRDELAWLQETLAENSRSWGARFEHVAEDRQTAAWQALSEFPAGDPAALTFVANVVPSGVPEFLAAVNKIDPAASLLARAGNGIVYIRTSLSAADAVAAHAKTLLPQARKQHGNCLVYAAASDIELTPLAAFGSPAETTAVFRRVKETFDPRGILSPGCLQN